MRKFSYSRQIGDEIFTAVEFDSFDEAKRIVDKAIYERGLELQSVLKNHPSVSSVGKTTPVEIKPPKVYNEVNAQETSTGTSDTDGDSQKPLE